MPSLALVVDVVNQRLVRDFVTNLDGSLPPLVQGSTYATTIRTVAPTGTTSNPFVDVDYTAYAFFLGLGVLNEPPSAGTFLVADGSAPDVFSAAIAFNASAASVQTALNAVAAISGAGGAVVAAASTSGAGGPWQVTWNTAGARDLLVIDTAGLDPISGSVVDRQITGDVDTQEIQTIYLLQVPSAYQDAWTPLPGAAGVVSDLVVGSGTVNAVQRIALLPLPYGGTFSVTCLGQQTTQIPFGDDGTMLLAALLALSSVGAGNVSVIQSGVCQWDVTFQGALAHEVIAAMAVNAAGLQVPLGVSGSVSLKVAGIDDLVENKVDTVDFQIDVTPPGGERFTIVQTDANLLASLFQAAFSPPTPVTSYPTTTAMNTAIAAAVALCAQIANNGSDFVNKATTLANLWLAKTATQGALLYMGAASALSVLAPNTTGTPKVLTMASSIPSWQVPSGGGGASPYVVQTANYVLAAGDKIAADTTATAINLDLYAGATTADLPIEIIDPQGTWGASNAALVPNGTDKINGVNASVTLNLSGAHVLIVWVGGATGWRVI